MFYLAVNPNKMGLCFHEDFIYYVYELVFSWRPLVMLIISDFSILLGTFSPHFGLKRNSHTHTEG